MSEQDLLVNIIIDWRLPWNVAEKLIRASRWLEVGPQYLKEFTGMCILERRS